MLVRLNQQKYFVINKIFKIVYYKFETNFLKKSSTDSPKSLIFWPRPILTDEFGVVVVSGVIESVSDVDHRKMSKWRSAI